MNLFRAETIGGKENYDERRKQCPVSIARYQFLSAFVYTKALHLYWISSKYFIIVLDLYFSSSSHFSSCCIFRLETFSTIFCKCFQDTVPQNCKSSIIRCTVKPRILHIVRGSTYFVRNRLIHTKREVCHTSDM